MALNHKGWAGTIARILKGRDGQYLAIAFALFLVPLLGVQLFILNARQYGVQEDAFIGLRHMRNFLLHGQLFFNIDDSAMGATSPLFWVFSAFFYKIIGLSGKEFGLIGCHYEFVFVCFVLAVMSFVVLARGVSRIVVATVILAFMCAFLLPARFLFLGLEGSYLLASIAVIAIFVRMNAPSGVVLFLAGILSWGRPELGLLSGFALCIAAGMLSSSFGQFLRHAAVLAVGWGVQPVVLFITTGLFLPSTVSAKSMFGAGIGAITGDPVHFLLDRIKYVDALLDFSFHSTTILMLISVWCVFFSFRSALISRQVGAVFRFVFALVVLGYGAFILLVPNLWEWYVSYWIMFVCVELGIVLYDYSISRLGDNAHHRRVVVGLCVSASIVLLVENAPRYFELRNTTAVWLQQESLFRGRLGRDLEERYHAKTVWMEAVGWQGYFNNAYVYDEVALVNRNVLKFINEEGCGYFMASLEALKPEFIVKRKFEFDRNRMITPPRECLDAPLFINEDARIKFNGLYELVETYDSAVPGYFGEYSHLLLFRRR